MKSEESAAGNPSESKGCIPEPLVRLSRDPQSLKHRSLGTQESKARAESLPLVALLMSSRHPGPGRTEWLGSVTADSTGRRCCARSNRGRQPSHGKIAVRKHESNQRDFRRDHLRSARRLRRRVRYRGTYVGILLVPAGLFGGKFCLKLATTRSEIYEQGFITKSWFGSVTARYADLKGISRYAVRVNGVLNTSVYFLTQSGEKVTMTRESIRNDKMTQLLDYACESLATTWMKTLNRQKEVVWLVKETVPYLRIRKDGVVYQGKNAQGMTGADEFISLNELQLKSGPLATVDICRGDTKIAKVNSAESNYFVGETLIAMLLENQRRPAETQPTDAPKRAMTARATS